MALFTLSSLAAGLAGSGDMLIATRAVQGVGAALLMPTTLAIIMATFTNVRERSMAIGIWAHPPLDLRAWSPRRWPCSR